jgi:hypothetical protein
MSDDETPGADAPSTTAPATTMATEQAVDREPSALMTRLRVIEDQPLETRAEALAQLHEELRAALEAGDARPHA